MDQPVSVIRVSSRAQPEDNFPLLTFAQLEWNMDRRTGIETGSNIARKTRARHRFRRRARAITP